MRAVMRRPVRLGLGALCLILVALVGWPVWLKATGNLHTVLPGRLYRSAQPVPGELERLSQEVGLRSVLNLRGARPDSDWYRREIAESQALGIVHADFGMAADKLLSPEDIRRLTRLMRELPAPVLIHCRAGADRTGLAVALYLARIAGMDRGEAGHQISFRYGHVGLPGLSGAWAMDQTWQAATALQEGAGS